MDQASYDLQDQTYPCNPAIQSTPATNAPVELGAMAATLQATLFRKIMHGDSGNATLFGAQLMFDTATYQKHLVHFKVNERCGFDHEIWCISKSRLEPRTNTLADLFDSLATYTDPVISLEGHSFSTHLDCTGCDKRRCTGLSLYRRLSEKARTCSCDSPMFATGLFSFESILRSDLSPSNLYLKLADLGFREGDVITVNEASGERHHIEIGTFQHHE
jgi:hypothetical protein